MWIKRAKTGPEISFFYHFLKFASLVFLAIAQIAAWDFVYHLVELKPTKKIVAQIRH